MNPIDVLPDNVLLEIFELYVKDQLYSRSWTDQWRPLVHVCRRWRGIVFGSPRRLDLRLYCTPRTPARDALNIWPALPLVVGGSMVNSGSGADNIIAALEQSNRVCSVDLGLAAQQLEQVFGVLQVPFLELTNLQITLQDDETLPVIPIPDSFLGGSAPLLEHFELFGIPFPGLPKLLLSTTHLITLRLYNIPHSGYISPEAMVALLSTLSSLKLLSLVFQSPQSRPDCESPSLPPPNDLSSPLSTTFNSKALPNI